MDDKMHIIALTGGIASGKSLIAAFFKKNYELVIIDADHLARAAVGKGTGGLKEITQVFGGQVICEDGSFDRKKMGTIIANDQEARKKLEAIVHPQVAFLYEQEINRQGQLGTKLIIYDCPLLFEANLQDSVDEIFLVVANEAIRASRIMIRNDVSKELAYKKIRMQMADMEKEIQADLIIENNGRINDLQITLKHYCAKRDVFVEKQE